MTSLSSTSHHRVGLLAQLASVSTQYTPRESRRPTASDNFIPTAVEGCFIVFRVRVIFEHPSTAVGKKWRLPPRQMAARRTPMGIAYSCLLVCIASSERQLCGCRTCFLLPCVYAEIARLIPSQHYWEDCVTLSCLQRLLESCVHANSIA